jgi:hypothetical protein
MEVGAKTVGNRSLNRKIMVPGQSGNSSRDCISKITIAKWIEMWLKQ